MQKQQGFTLIELIVVIIILGILAVTAAPKFIDVQGDAQKAAMEGVAGALRSGKDLVFAKAAAEGKLNGTKDKPVNVTTSIGNVATAYGYPIAGVANDNDKGSGILTVVDITNIDKKGSSQADSLELEYIYEVSGNDVIIAPGRLTTTQNALAADCRVTYTQATNTKAATVTSKLDKCG